MSSMLSLRQLAVGTAALQKDSSSRSPLSMLLSDTQKRADGTAAPDAARGASAALSPDQSSNVSTAATIPSPSQGFDPFASSSPAGTSDPNAWSRLVTSIVGTRSQVNMSPVSTVISGASLSSGASPPPSSTSTYFASSASSISSARVNQISMRSQSPLSIVPSSVATFGLVGRPNSIGSPSLSASMVGPVTQPPSSPYIRKMYSAALASVDEPIASTIAPPHNPPPIAVASPTFVPPRATSPRVYVSDPVPASPVTTNQTSVYASPRPVAPDAQASNSMPKRVRSIVRSASAVVATSKTASDPPPKPSPLQRLVTGQATVAVAVSPQAQRARTKIADLFDAEQSVSSATALTELATDGASDDAFSGQVNQQVHSNDSGSGALPSLDALLQSSPSETLLPSPTSASSATAQPLVTPTSMPNSALKNRGSLVSPAPVSINASPSLTASGRIKKSVSFAVANEDGDVSSTPRSSGGRPASSPAAAVESTTEAINMLFPAQPSPSVRSVAARYRQLADELSSSAPAASSVQTEPVAVAPKPQASPIPPITSRSPSIIALRQVMAATNAAADVVPPSPAPAIPAPMPTVSTPSRIPQLIEPGSPVSQQVSQTDPVVHASADTSVLLSLLRKRAHSETELTDPGSVSLMSPIASIEFNGSTAVSASTPRSSRAKRLAAAASAVQ